MPATSERGLNLSRIPCSRRPLVRLDERAPDVAVLDHALGERDAARAGEADRGRRARVRCGHDEVGLDRSFRGEPLAHPDAGRVHLDPGEGRVRAGEVDELEEAERTRAGLRDRLRRLDAVLVDQDELAGRHLALVVGADEVERARLGGEHRVAVDPAQVERPEAVGVAEADELPLGERDDREGSLEPPHRVRDRIRERRRVVGDRAPRSPRCRRSSRAGFPRRRARSGASRRS